VSSAAEASRVMNHPAAIVIARPPVGSIQFYTKWSAMPNQLV